MRLLVGSDAVSPPSFASFDLTYRIPESYVLKAAAALPSNRASPGTVSAGPSGDIGTPEKALGWQAIWSAHQVRIAVLGVGLAALTVILFLQDVISRRRRLHRVVRVGFLLWTLVWLGWYAGAQLTIVNLITYIHTLVKDWPQMTFVIYHSALRPFLELPDQAWAEFEASGRIKWTSDLAEIPAKYGVTNVYGEIGTSFANSAVAQPKFAAAMVATLIKGLGADHVLWGTDSVWYGSPQWQIEAMRRLEIPEDMQKKYGFAPLGGANGAVKQGIFGLNSARLYRLNLKAADARPMPAYSADRLAQLKKEYEFAAKEPSNLRYGYVRAG